MPVFTIYAFNQLSLMSLVFLDLKFVAGPWVRAWDMGSVWPSSFTTYRGGLLLAEDGSWVCFFI